MAERKQSTYQLLIVLALVTFDRVEQMQGVHGIRI